MVNPKTMQMEIKWDTRLCTVNGRPGFFHTWEQWSEVVGESPLVGGHPAGAVSCVYGIVEFANGVERVDPTSIRFADEHNSILTAFEKAFQKKYGGEKK